ncbi:MAG: hypothetical protein ACREIR_15160, partial [Geminicoccaceae bacterium]
MANSLYSLKFQKATAALCSARLASSGEHGHGGQGEGVLGLTPTGRRDLGGWRDLSARSRRAALEGHAMAAPRTRPSSSRQVEPQPA